MKTRAAVATEATKPLEIDLVITLVLAVEEINEASNLMHAGKSIRSVVVY